MREKARIGVAPVREDGQLDHAARSTKALLREEVTGAVETRPCGCRAPWMRAGSCEGEGRWRGRGGEGGAGGDGEKNQAFNISMI